MIIRNFNIDLNFISNNGETRQFVVEGGKNSIFSLVVHIIIFLLKLSHLLLKD